MPDQSSKTTPVTATVFDPAPPVSPFAVIGPALAIAGAILAFASIGSAAGGWLFAIGVAATLLHGLRRRKKARQTRVFCNVGALRIPEVGTIRARDITGATTARYGDQLSLMLAHAKRRGPIFIDIADETSLRAICKSLGIGHHGFGAVDVPTQSSGADKLRYVTHGATLASMLAAFIASGEARTSLSSLTVMAGLTTLVVAVLALATPSPRIRMAGNGVFLPTKDGTAFAPFDAIEKILQLPNAIVFDVRTAEKTTVRWIVDVRPATWRRQASSFEELEQLVAQIRAAVDRAHGQYVVKAEPETALAKLRRAQGEPLRTWLARIDTINMGAAGYRELSIDPHELWSLLEDPEAEPDTRAAAARVLARVTPSELKVRVANVLATERNKRTRARIAASLDDEALVHEEEEEQSQVHVIKS